MTSLSTGFAGVLRSTGLDATPSNSACSFVSFFTLFCSSLDSQPAILQGDGVMTATRSWAAWKSVCVAVGWCTAEGPHWTEALAEGLRSRDELIKNAVTMETSGVVQRITSPPNATQHCDPKQHNRRSIVYINLHWTSCRLLSSCCPRSTLMGVCDDRW
jgi:hypothetical protein